MLLLNEPLLSSCSASFVTVTSIRSSVRSIWKNRSTSSRSRFVKERSSQNSLNVLENEQLNDFFRDPLPESVKEYIVLKKIDKKEYENDKDLVETIIAGPESPGVPRSLSTVILASIPTGLVWYGYYKFCIEEELFYIEKQAGKDSRGFGGYGTLGPFTYGLLLGPFAELLHIPGGINWSATGIIFIYYTQFLLYERVNSLYDEEGLEPPLTVWWCWPIFFPFNLIVGLRQVHFLSQYFYRKRGISAPSDPVAEFFPFIAAENFSWQDFVLKPSLWCSLLQDKKDFEKDDLPEPLVALMEFNFAELKKN